MDAATVQQLANALTALSDAINAMNAAPTPVTDLHGSANAYNLHTREGKAAYDEACAPFERKFDGSNETLPQLIIDLKAKARDCNWDACTAGNVPEPHNIIRIPVGPAPAGGGPVPTKNLFSEISSISVANLQAAFTTHSANPRAKQNAECLYKCLSKSFTGDLHSNFFSQPHNLPADDYGPLLFKLVVEFTNVNTMQTAFDIASQLHLVDPSKFGFNIIKINAELTRLFILHSVGVFGPNQNDQFKVMIMLETYTKIKRPEAWATAVEQWNTQCASGILTDPTVLASRAVSKYTDLKHFTGEYSASLLSSDHTITAMFAKGEKQMAALLKASTKTKATSKTSNDDDDDDADSKPPASEGGDKKPQPPFVTHTKKPCGGGPYKEGDEKTWKGKTYYYHVAPTHKDKKKWFIHPVPGCLTCRKFKNKESEKEKSDEKENTSSTVSALSDLTNAPSKGNVEMLLEEAYNQAQELEDLEDKEALNAYIADALGLKMFE